MSTNRFQHWRWQEDERGMVWLHLNVAGERVNVLSTAVLSELESILDTLEASSVKGLAFISDKPSGFIAGADVKEFTRLSSREQTLAMIKRGQAIMDRIDALPFPTVAVINGFCMGGGTELSLACDYRIGLDDPKTRLGLPEIKLGIHPGYGGTMRSLRVLGPIAAMDMMLTGRGLDVYRARKIGLIDHAVPQRHLVNATHHLLETTPRPHRPNRLLRLLGQWPVRRLLARKMRNQVTSKVSKAHYPAPYALIDLWEQHGGDEGRMLDQEAQSVADLSITETARNLIRVFMLQNRLKAAGDKSLIEPRHIHVIGAGLMGGDIAAWCALQGFRVTVQDPSTRSLAATVERAARLFTRRLKTERRIKSVMDRLIPDEKGSGVKHADVVIEAIFEDIEAKQTLYRNIEPKLKPGALVTTNTSSIPIDTLAQGFSDPGRLAGLHFFNPVAQLPLVEIVHGEHTREETINRALAFTRHIDKLPLKVKGSPGFLVNRILMPYLLEAIIMESEGIPKTVIDQVAIDFGMPMGPIELADTVGLDIGLHVGEILGKAYGFQVPTRLKDMVSNGHLGRKTGQGFYPYQNGKPIKPKKEPSEHDREELQERLILRLINEAIACLREGVVEDADMVDAGVIFGTGFAPFRGGPLHYLKGRGRQAMQESLKQLQNRFGDRFAADDGW
ncbi:MAG: 3-hydroxyacyl-CoA dehydrogenase NAD-binding domain-containing protein [Pseudomonadota bacterium]